MLGIRIYARMIERFVVGRKIYFMLFIFSFFNQGSPFFRCMINLIMQQRSSLDRICRIHSRIFPRRLHIQAHTYAYTSLGTRDVRRHYRRFTRRNIRTDDVRSKKRKEKEDEEQQQRGRSTEEEEVEVGHRLPRRDATNTHARIRIRTHVHVRAGRLFKRIAPVTSSFRPLSRALEPFENLSRGLPSSVEFGVERESCELLAWLILLRDFVPNYALSCCRSQ